MFVLVAYDIQDAKRRRRLAALMEDYGARRQLSVFECIINKDQLAELIKKIKAIIKHREDKVQIYHLCEACRQRFGRWDQSPLAGRTEVYIC